VEIVGRFIEPGGVEILSRFVQVPDGLFQQVDLVFGLGGLVVARTLRAFESSEAFGESV